MTSAASLFGHPALALIVGAALVAVLRGPPRALVALVAPLVALGLVLHADDGVHASTTFVGVALSPFAVDAVSRLFGIVFAIMAFGGALFGLHQPRRLELPAALLYAGAALGVTFAGDLVTVFLCWELMAVGSTLVLWSAATPRAYRASLRYLMIHLLGGTLLLLGIGAQYATSGSLAFGLAQPASAGYWLILAGFLVNAGAPPLSAWVADAYPEASFSGTVFLSAFTTKIAVYALLRAFPGEPLLVALGVFMAAYGIAYALLENDMRRLLAYGIVNQVGVMLVGIGIGSPIALDGVAAMAFTHILYKGLLLMTAGAIVHATGKCTLSEVGGLARSMPWTAVLAAVGVLSMSAPATLGFVTKSMIAQAAAEAHRIDLWLALLAASAGAFALIGLRYAWLAFAGRDSGLRPADPPLNMRLAMVLFAALCIGLGIWYEPLYRLLPFATDYRPYTGAHVVSQLQLLLFAGLAFFALLPLMRGARTITLDVDWLYRRALPALIAAVARVWHALAQGWRTGWQGVLVVFAAQVRRTHGPEGILARTWSIRSMGLWMLALLLALLLLGYFA